MPPSDGFLDRGRRRIYWDARGFALRYPLGSELRRYEYAVRIDLPFSAGTTLREKFLLVSIHRPGPEASWGTESMDFRGRRFLLEREGEGAAGSRYEVWRYTT